MLNREIALGEGNCFVNLGEHAGNLAGSIGRGSARRSLKISLSRPPRATHLWLSALTRAVH